MMVAGLHAETRMVAGPRAVPNFVFLAAAIRATRRPVGLEVQKRGTREMTRRAGGEAWIMMTRSTAVSVQGKFWRTVGSQLAAGITCANLAIRTLMSIHVISKAIQTWRTR